MLWEFWKNKWKVVRGKYVNCKQKEKRINNKSNNIKTI